MSLKLTLYRIIPIYMGSTLLAEAISSSVENHPHIHGEYLAIAKVSALL